MAKKKSELACMEGTLDDFSFPTIPAPEEPQEDPIIKELENKNNNLTQKIYQQEQEITQLRNALAEQDAYFKEMLARTIIAILGDK